MEIKGLLVLLLEIPVVVVTVVVEEVTKVLTKVLTTPLTTALTMMVSPSLLTRFPLLTMRLTLTGVVCEISAITHILNNYIWDRFREPEKQNCLD